MSKKLIAVASAAALALAGLVAMPTVATANVGPFTVTATGSQATNQVLRDGTTSDKALRISVPSADVLRHVAEETPASVLGTLIKLDIQTPGATDAITVTATGGVKVITDTQLDASTAPTTASGTQALTDAAANGDAVIYAYTTSTSAGTVVISAAGSSRTVFIQGRSIWAYKIALTAPASASLGGKITTTATAVDMFGNNLTTALGEGDFTFGQVGATTPVAGVDGFSHSITTNLYTIVWMAPTTAQGVAIQATLNANKRSTKVTAYGDPVNVQFASVSVVDLAAQVTALNAQITALTAQLAALTASTVTKADYNKLVRKYNRTNPAKKVARVL